MGVVATLINLVGFEVKQISTHFAARAETL